MKQNQRKRWLSLLAALVLDAGDEARTCVLLTPEAPRNFKKS